MKDFDAVYKAIKKIPKGKVSTYGRVARHIGISNPKVVGYALHSNKTPDIVPCHRVVNIIRRTGAWLCIRRPNHSKTIIGTGGNFVF